MLTCIHSVYYLHILPRSTLFWDRWVSWTQSIHRKPIGRLDSLEIYCALPQRKRPRWRRLLPIKGKKKKLVKIGTNFCMKDGIKDRWVLHRRVVPLLVPELELTLGNAITGVPAHIHQIISVEHAEFLLSNQNLSIPTCYNSTMWFV